MTDPYALLAVGGGPAGLAAVRAYREADGAGRVAIVTDEHRMPYSRPPLTKELLRGEGTEADLPIEQESWLTDQRVELIGGRAVALDADTRTVGLSGGRELEYECCLLATGAEPARPPIPGGDDPRVHVIRTLDHVRNLIERLVDGARVAVIGSGFIGCEVASSLRLRGHEVDLLSDETAPNVARLGDEVGGILRNWLTDDGVELHLGAPVERIDHVGGSATITAGASRISAEAVVLAAGVAPRTELAAQAGLELDDRAIPVDAAMRTRQERLLAAGDACKADNAKAGRSLRVEHWGDALTQGEIAGRSAAGQQARWESVPGFWSTIGRRTLKYAAWGDGHDDVQMRRGVDGAFTAWYLTGGTIVGVLTHEADADYETGSRLIAEEARWAS
jgi:3-phenylpropionate/trans-cinnamate dioxygenase ferredoxin reductase component